MTMTIESANSPPAFEPNTVQLLAASSKIESVSVYSNQAEVTRLFKISLGTGQNQVYIDGLPMRMDRNSLRVEGRGPATIHDVTVSDTPTTPSISPKLMELLSKKERLQKALERTEESLDSLKTFLGTLSIRHVSPGQLGSVMDDYEATAAKLDNRVLDQKAELETLNKEIVENQTACPGGDETRVSVGVFADEAADVELVLKYAVTGASWVPAYDLRVNMEDPDSSVTLIYKAIVQQNTGESWENVPLTLETASPTYGVELPWLNNWTLSIHERRPTLSVLAGAAPPPGAAMKKFDRGGIADEQKGVPMLLATSYVASKPNISGTATFKVPGLASIPTNSGDRTFTVASLKLSAAMTWETVPRMDSTKVVLKAKILNASEYTLLSGQASVYLDGSFIAKSTVPAVSPNETFECPLGLDPSIRITYHPLSKKASSSGFAFYSNKTTSYMYTRRLTVHNTKFFTVPLLKIVDQIPVSEDERITVKLIKPALKLSNIDREGTLGRASSSTLSQTQEANGSGSKLLMSFRSSKGSDTSPLAQVTSAGSTVKVSDGVIAQWNGANLPEVDVDTLGQDGKMNWLCEVPAQGKINLELQWEVSFPSKSHVLGL